MQDRKAAGTNPGRAGSLILAVALVLGIAAAAEASVRLTVGPTDLTVARGEVFEVDLQVGEAGSPFNAYDAVVGFDPAVLTFLPGSAAEQEGPLMADPSCQTFHHFEVAPSGDRLVINHVLLCQGTSLTGPGVVYRLRFRAGDVDASTALTLLEGTRVYDAGVEVFPVLTGNARVQIGNGGETPDPLAGRLLRAAPNPFNPGTEIAFQLPEEGIVVLEIFDGRGRRIRTLLHEHRSRGIQRIPWDGTDAAGRRLASGVYQVRLVVAGGPSLIPVTLLK